MINLIFEICKKGRRGQSEICFDRKSLHCNFKKGGSSTTVQSYQPTPEERRLMDQAAKYSEAVAPNALRLNDTARDLLWQSLGSTKVDYNTLNNNAQRQISNATGGLSNMIGANTSATNAANARLESLVNGKLPSQYQTNMENSIRSALNNTMGTTINSLGQRGVLNSSVTNAAMNDISKNAADTVAQQYQNNIGTVSGLMQEQLGNTMNTNQFNTGLYGNLIDSAGTPISVAAAAQEAAQQPALNLWNASVGLNQGGTGTALAGVSGKGTTTSTQNMSGGGGLLGNTLGGLFGGIASGWASAWCFGADTLIKMADGTAKYIQDIVRGDKVLCPHVDGTESVEEVLSVMEPHYADVYALTATDENDDYHVAFTTSTQPILCDDGTFVTVGNMKLGKKLRGGLELVSVEYDEFCPVYDLKVSGENNYYADGFVAKGGTNEW